MMYRYKISKSYYMRNYNKIHYSNNISKYKRKCIKLIIKGRIMGPKVP